jgi:hypothetical protein
MVRLDVNNNKELPVLGCKFIYRFPIAICYPMPDRLFEDYSYR